MNFIVEVIDDAGAHESSVTRAAQFAEGILHGVMPKMQNLDGEARLVMSQIPTSAWLCF